MYVGVSLSNSYLQSQGFTAKQQLNSEESALMPRFRNCKVKSEYVKMVKQNSQFQLPEKVNHHVPFFVFSEHYAKLASLDLVLHPLQ